MNKTLMKQISSGIFERVLEPGANLWCSKLLVKLFNQTVQHMDKSLRPQLFEDTFHM